MNNAVIIEETFDAQVARVWQAITDKDKMKQWYFDLDAFEAVPGFRFTFAGKGHKGEHYLHICEITEVVLHKKLQYTWRYENVDGISLVTFELFPEGKKTRLRLTHSGLDSFPAGHPDFARESFYSGWTHIMNVSLRDFIKGTQN